LGFVRYLKGYELLKRSRALAGRPIWQDTIPDTAAGRDSYRIAVKHEKAFSRAFLRAMRNLMPEEKPVGFTTLWRKGNLDEIMATLPFFNAGEINQPPAWQGLIDSLERAYGSIVFESGVDASQRMNKKFKTNFRFTLNDKSENDLLAEHEQIIKADIPINPYSISWIKSHALELVAEGISVPQISTVRDILLRNFSAGARAELVYEDIKRNIGLTDREYKAVQNRRLLHTSAGLPDTQIDVLVGDYKEKLLKARAVRIARTETIKAQAEGRRTAWRLAQDEGILPEVVREWISAPASLNPTRPCAICLDLDGKEADLNGAYESEFLGPVLGPPSHPHCRCTETIKQKE